MRMQGWAPARVCVLRVCLPARVSPVLGVGTIASSGTRRLRCQARGAAEDTEEPRRVLAQFLEIVARKAWNETLPLLPSHGLGKALTLLRPGPDSELSRVGHVIEEMLVTKQDHFMDSYALRNLVLAPPTDFKDPISCLRVSHDTFMARVAVAAPSGEEVVLTFTLKRNTVPGSPLSHNLGPHDSSLPHVSNGQWPTWRLASVAGESQHAVVNGGITVPSPEWAPEDIVKAQLQQLQQYEFAQAFALLTPSSQLLVGPLEKFIASMGRNRLYRPLVHHRSATTVRRLQQSHNVYMEVVACQGGNVPGIQLYCWVLSKQDSAGPLQDCWLTEWVKPLKDL